MLHGLPKFLKSLSQRLSEPVESEDYLILTTYAYNVLESLEFKVEKAERGVNREFLVGYVGEFIWRNRAGGNHFETMLAEIALQY